MLFYTERNKYSLSNTLFQRKVTVNGYRVQSKGKKEMVFENYLFIQLSEGVGSVKVYLSNREKLQGSKGAITHCFCVRKN